MTVFAAASAAASDDRRTRRRRRFRALMTPEAVVGALIAAVWGFLAPAYLAPPPVVMATILLALGLHVATVDSGSFALLWISTGWVLLLIIVWARGMASDADPLVFTAAGSSALVYNELVRLAYARRRNARIDRSVYASSATGVALAVLLAGTGIGLSDGLAGAVGRSWLWMPLAVLVVSALATAFVTLPTVGAPSPHKDRWQPGERIPPQRQRSMRNDRGR